MIYASVINTLLQRFGYFISKAIRSVVAAFMQIAQYVGRAIMQFVLGIVEEVFSQMPGVPAEQVSGAVEFARGELEKWNAIFPIYEALTCMSVIFAWRIILGMYRAYMTLVWNMGNLHNAMPKIGGTG